MTNNRSIKLKAAFLLTVFALNTVIAFACSVGLKLGYNNHHHGENKKQATVTKPHCHSGKQASHHRQATSPDEAVRSHDDDTPAQDDCCNKSAVQFQQVDKSHAYAAKIQISTPVILLAAQYAYNVSLLHLGGNALHKQHYFVQSDHPPIPDIRVAIQSFQV